MSIVLIIKFISLVLSIVYGISIMGKIQYKVTVHSQFVFIFGISLATFIFLQFKLF